MKPSSLAVALFAIFSLRVLEASVRVAKFADRVSEEPAELVGQLVDAENPRTAIEASAAAFKVELDSIALAADVVLIARSLSTLIAAQIGEDADEPPETDPEPDAGESP